MCGSVRRRRIRLYVRRPSGVSFSLSLVFSLLLGFIFRISQGIGLPRIKKLYIKASLIVVLLGTI